MCFTYTLCVVMALLHVAFGIAEMFYYRPIARKLSKTLPNPGLDPENMEKAIKWSEFLAFNQGVYNLFLAAGFFMCLRADMMVNIEHTIFFSCCAIVAGLAGSYKGVRATLIVQTLPGAVMLFTTYLGW